MESGGFPEELLGICKACGVSWGSLLSLGELLCIGVFGGYLQSLCVPRASLCPSSVFLCVFGRPGGGKWYGFLGQDGAKGMLELEIVYSLKSL